MVVCINWMFRCCFLLKHAENKVRVGCIVCITFQRYLFFDTYSKKERISLFIQFLFFTRLSVINKYQLVGVYQSSSSQNSFDLLVKVWSDSCLEPSEFSSLRLIADKYIGSVIAKGKLRTVSAQMR